MSYSRQFKTTLTSLLFLVLSSGLLFAQYQNGAPGYGQDQGYPQQEGAPAYPQGQPGGYGQDQSGAPAPPPPYPGNGAPQNYPGQPAQGSQEIPGRVARIQYMSGDVSTQPGGVNDWIAASQNRPLTTSDRIWTDKNSRAELNVGDGFIRMNAETSLTLTNVSDNTVQLELDQGTLSLTVRHLDPGEIYEVDTPNYAFTVTKAGNYRFDVFPSEDQSWVTVRKGEGEATGRGAAVRVKSGEQMRFGSGNSLQHTAESAPTRDGFDDWVQVRDKLLDNSLSAQYVSPGVVGYQDLDAYGRWVPTPSYGTVWVPTAVPVGWAPYRYGHWVWIAPWGWTWVDDAPWGFAPFHYGRWVYWGGAWAWAPGPVGYWRPYYAPALVGWIGGPGFGVGIGFPGFSIGVNFGWFPLGWGEPFYPRYCGWGWGGWYRGGGYVSAAYFHNVNITNTHITNITNITNNYYSGNTPAANYGFRNMPGAVTAAPASAITSGAAINRAGAAVPASQLGKGTLLNAANVNPTRQSVLGGNAPQTRGVPPASAFNRGVVTANKPPAATARPAGLETANAATLSHGNLNALGNTRGNSAAGPANGARPATTTSNSGRPGQPTTGRGTGPSGSNAATQSRGPATAGTEARVDTTPTSQGGRYVPRPPSAGGVSTPSTHSGTTTNSNGSRANTGNGSYGHSSTAQNGYPRTNGGTTTSPQYRPPSTTGNQAYGGSSVPKPPQSSQPAAPKSANPSHQGAPSHSQSHESHESSHGPGAALSNPGASYHAAPTYSASANYGSRPFNGYSGGGRSSYGSGYSGRSSGSYSTPNFGNRSYGSSGYTARSAASSSGYASRGYGSSPAYGSRSTSSYSGRSSSQYSAGNNGYHAPGGVGHASGGGGGRGGR